MKIIEELFDRNFMLASFGAIAFLCAIVCLVLAKFTTNQVLGISAWIKPGKFYLSTAIFVWTMAWICHYLSQEQVVAVYNWSVVAILSFELVYITWMAGAGETSHFNVSSSFKATMFSLMGVAIGVMTLFTAYIGILFFKSHFSELPIAYLWGIRLGILLFVIFALQGYVMGARMSHTVGASDGGTGLRFLNWSVQYGDLRVAHFFGMHALQILPLAGFYLFSSKKGLFLMATMYLVLAVTTLVLALRGVPIVKLGAQKTEVYTKAKPNL